MVESAAEKELTLKKKIGTIGNIVHESVPTNNDEVSHGTRRLNVRSDQYTGLQ